jgi:hypothetical protein
MSELDYKGRKIRRRPTHFVAVIVAHENAFTTRKIACGLDEENALIATEVKEQVTCKRCQRSPYFDPALYRGRY